MPRDLAPLNKRGNSKYPVFGYGNETVYVYYYDTYRLYAEEKGLEFFPCKIGYTVKTALERIGYQAQGMPEKPTIPFIIKSEWARELESLLQAVIFDKPNREKYNRNYDGRGLEWYLTNPEEIRAEAIKYGQFRKDARKVLEEYNAMRTNWTTERSLAAKREFPEKERVPAFYLLKIPKGK